MPFEPGNKLAAGPRGKPFKDALKRAIANAEGEPEALKKIAETLITKAIAGEGWAVALVAERLDGKVPQAIVGDDEHGPIRVEQIQRVIVDPTNSDSESVPSAPGTEPL